VQATFGTRQVAEVCEAVARHMLKDQVVKLVLQHAQLVRIFQLAHEVGVIKQLKLTIFSDSHASSRDRTGCLLVDPP